MQTNPPSEQPVNPLTDLQRSVLTILKNQGFDAEVRILASHWLAGYRVAGPIDPHHKLHTRMGYKIRRANQESNLKDRPDVNTQSVPASEETIAEGGAEVGLPAEAEPAAAQVE